MFSDDEYASIAMRILDQMRGVMGNAGPGEQQGMQRPPGGQPGMMSRPGMQSGSPGPTGGRPQQGGLPGFRPRAQGMPMMPQQPRMPQQTLMPPWMFGAQQQQQPSAYSSQRPRPAGPMGVYDPSQMPMGF